MRTRLLVLLGLASCAFAHPESGKPAPEITIDRIVSGSAPVKGQALVLEFWATWCTPCRDQIPHFNRLASKFRDRPVTFLALTDEDDEALLRRFLRDKPMESSVGMDLEAKTFSRYGIAGRPATVLIDAAGLVRATLTAGRPDEAMIEALLAGKPIEERSAANPAGTVAAKTYPKAGGDVFELRIRPAEDVSVSGYSPGAMLVEGPYFKAFGFSIQRLIALAYDFPDQRVIVADPLTAGRYDLVMTANGDLTRSHATLKQALGEAFQLSVTGELRPTDVYVLGVTEAGLKNVNKPETASTRIWLDAGKLTAVNASFSGLASRLEPLLGKPVLNETQLDGRYDFTLQMRDLQSSIETQLGLTLRPAVRKLDYLVVR